MGAPIQDASRMERPGYRSAKTLPTQLLDHCTVCFEEELLSQAFALLSAALTSGTGTTLPAQVPPVQHLALVATLSVHPQFTTRTDLQEKHQAADAALEYLRHVLKLAGSSNAGLNKAFRFAEKTTTLRNKRAKTRNSDINSDSGDEDSSSIRTPYANKESLWTNAEDFWSIVGWAFNCSVAHKPRWRRWKLWLDFMLDVLEADLASHAESSTVPESLLAYYLQPLGEGRNNKRRLMRAILADGKPKSLAEFHEIWRNETKPPKKKSDEEVIGKKRKLDIENGEFGDYFDEDSDEDSPAIMSMRRSRSASAFPSAKQGGQASGDEDDNSAEDDTDHPKRVDRLPGIEDYGGTGSIHLRQRLLALLTRFCYASPASFLDTEDLFDLCTEFLRPLPLPVFQQFVLPSKPYLDVDSQSSLDQMLLRPLLANEAPAYNDNAVTQAEFETHYAPFGANTTAATDIAKVSLLVESLMSLLWKSGGLSSTASLKKVLERGIKARRDRFAFDGRRRTGVKAQKDEEAGTMMNMSALRMETMSDMMTEG